MTLDDADLVAGLDIALNEADLCDCRINERTGEVRLLFLILNLPEGGGPEPKDRRTVLSFTGVARIVAWLRSGAGLTEVVPLRLEDVPSSIRSFGCQPVYGWDFFDLPETEQAPWRRTTSLDHPVLQGRGSHSVDLFQEGAWRDGFARRLDLRLEFDDLRVLNAKGREVSLDEFVAGARRWWAALADGDPRVAGHGIRLAPPDGR